MMLMVSDKKSLFWPPRVNLDSVSCQNISKLCILIMTWISLNKITGLLVKYVVKGVKIFFLLCI